MDDLRNLTDKIRGMIKARSFHIENTRLNLGPEPCALAMAFYNKPITYRTTDFKSNEYRNLLGGSLFEHVEEAAANGCSIR